MIHDWQHHLACTLISGFATATLEQQLDVLLTWLGNPDNLHVADLDAAIAASGLARDEATERAYDILDGLLFADLTGPPHLILGLPPTADAVTVKQRYRRLIQAYHPDRHPALAALHNQRTEQINLAYAAFERGEWGAAAAGRSSDTRRSSGTSTGRPTGRGAGRSTGRPTVRPAGRSAGRASGPSSGPSAKAARPREPKVGEPASLGSSLKRASLGTRLRPYLGRAETFQSRFFAGLILFCIVLLALQLYPEAPPPRLSSDPDATAPPAPPSQPTAVGALDTPLAHGSVPVASALPRPSEPRPPIDPPVVITQQPAGGEQVARVAVPSAELPNWPAEAPRLPAPPPAQVDVSPRVVSDLAPDPVDSPAPEPVTGVAAVVTPQVAEGQAGMVSDPIEASRSNTAISLNRMLAMEIERQLLLADIEAERRSDSSVPAPDRLPARPDARSEVEGSVTRRAPSAQDIGSRATTPPSEANPRASALAPTGPMAPIGPARPAPLPDPLIASDASVRASSSSDGAATLEGCDTVVGVLERFRLAYNVGSLDALMALYDADARERGVQGRPGIRRLYARLFETTFERRITFYGTTARAAEHGQCGLRARFRVTYQTSDGKPVEQAGTLDVLLDRAGPAARILSITY